MIINFHIETHPKVYKDLHCISLVFLLRVLLLRVINMVLSVLLISLVLHVTIADSFLDNLRYMYDVNENSRNSDVSDVMPDNKNLGDSGNAAPPPGLSEKARVSRGDTFHTLMASRKPVPGCSWI